MKIIFDKLPYRAYSASYRSQTHGIFQVDQFQIDPDTQIENLQTDHVNYLLCEYNHAQMSKNIPFVSNVKQKNILYYIRLYGIRFSVSQPTEFTRQGINFGKRTK